VKERPAGLPHHSVRLVWEYPRQARGGTEWVALNPGHGELDDDTRAFTLNGRVRLTVPGVMASQSKGSFLIRCRLEAGSYDAAPVILNLCLNGVAAEQAVPVGSATGIGKENIEAVRLGVSDGTPWQEFKLSDLPAQEDGFREFTPVQEISFRLFTLSSGTWIEWEKRADFDASGRDAIHYVLDAATGTITFGDGGHGQVPARGAVIYAAYRATRADAGKLAAGAIRTVVNSLHNRAFFGSEQALLQMRTHFATITNSVPALGGAAAESLSAAEARAIELREAPLRAVTLSDLKSLALATPGTQLARVEALANSHPSFPCVKATGVVTLIVLPYLPRAKPMPSPGLCRALAAYLAGRRLLGTRVEIVAPTYLEVGVRARVRVAPTADKNVLQQTIVDALDKFLHPLRGGPDGTGWPFGRDVYRSEVLQVIDQIAGVEHVLSLDLVIKGGEPQCGNICLAPTWLTVASEHRIEVI